MLGSYDDESGIGIEERCLKFNMHWDGYPLKSKFNAKLKAASKAGKLSGKFKEAVDASPMAMKKAAMKMKKESMAMLKKSTMMMKKASAMKMKMKKK